MAIGLASLYVSLAGIFLWVGGMKFTAYEAQAILVFSQNSPVTSWLYPLFGIQGVSNILGVYEVATGLLLLSRIVSPRLSSVGGIMSIITYLVTLSFLFTTPGVGAQPAGGFPALSAEIGQFLAKDMALLAISLFVTGESLQAKKTGLDA
ncbi:MAG: DUF417 family protein [Chitinophagales bacterium]|nr:DUF417 family protein [Hyphomicrobiales bacterium]